MSLSEQELEELSYIFSHLSTDWLSNKDYSPASFCQGKFKFHSEFTIYDIDNQINAFCYKNTKESPDECLKLKSLLNFTSNQIEIWNTLSKKEKEDIISKYKSSFPSVLYLEVWDSSLKPKPTLDKNKPKINTNSAIKKQAKEKINSFFINLKFFDKNPKDLLFQSKLTSNLVEQKYSHSNFINAEENIHKLQAILEEVPTYSDFELSDCEEVYSFFLSNIELLKKQCSLFLNITAQFKKQGKLLVSSQLPLEHEIFENYSLVFYNQEITTNEKLQEILFEYINHNGIYYLDMLLNLNLNSSNPEHQSFFLHSPFKLKTKNSNIIYLKKEGEAESIKTLKQGRIGNLEKNIKSPHSFGNKTNRQLSKYELIGRILKNIQTILLTYETLQTMKVSEYDMKTIKSLVESLPNYNEEYLESLEAKYLFRISQDIFGAVATVRKLQQKYS